MMNPIRFSKIALLLVISLIATSSQASDCSMCINPGNIISVVTEDFNKDGGIDKAILSRMQDDDIETELFIYMQDLEADDGNKPTIHKKKIAWTGSLYGTQPSLSVNQKGSLIIISANQAVGRDRWQQKLTVVYRNEEWRVGGYTYESYDTLDVDKEFSCDANLLTGRAVVNAKKVMLDKKGGVKLKDWSDSDIPKVCRPS